MERFDSIGCKKVRFVQDRPAVPRTDPGRDVSVDRIQVIDRMRPCPCRCDDGLPALG